MLPHFPVVLHGIIRPGGDDDMIIVAAGQSMPTWINGILPIIERLSHAYESASKRTIFNDLHRADEKRQGEGLDQDLEMSV